MSQLTKSAKFYSDLITEAHSSEDFKQELLENPRAAIQSFNSAVSIPENVSIVVEDQSNSDVVYFNIPRQMEVDDLELSMDELEMVAGGAPPALVAITIATNLWCVAGGLVCIGIGVVIGMND